MLTGCITREQADSRLESGCTAAAGIFLNEGYTVKSVEKSTFGESKEFGAGYRVTDLTIIESNGWAELDKEVECTFAEDLGVFGSSHNADLHQLKVNNEIYGSKGANTSMIGLFGDVDKHMKVNIAVEKAMTTQK